MSPGHATVWVFPAETTQLEARLSRMASFLSVGERAHSQQINDTKARVEYVATRFFIRALLSRAVPERAPGDWVFNRGEFGKPFVEDLIGISFNISHTDGLIAAAFTVGHEIGLDVERVNRDRADLLKIAPDYFSSSELRELAVNKDPVRRFFDLWAVKESYIKARGMGLDFRLQQVSFVVPPVGAGPVPVAFAPIIDDHEDEWKFFLFDDATITRAFTRTGAPDGEFSLGLGIRAGSQNDIEIACVEFVPQELE